MQRSALALGAVFAVPLWIDEATNDQHAAPSIVKKTISSNLWIGLSQCLTGSWNPLSSPLSRNTLKPLLYMPEEGPGFQNVFPSPKS